MLESFFAGIEQQQAMIGDFPARTPTFYRDARGFALIFPARLGAIREALPDRRLRPARLLPGVGAVHLTAFEYYDTDIGPYNEFAVGVLLESPDHRRGPPGYNLLRQLACNEFHSYVLQLPVDTERARRAGVELYNYPKILAEIEFHDTTEHVACEVKERGELICRVQARKLPTRRGATAKFFCHLYQDRQPQSLEFKVDLVAYAAGRGPGRGHVELGRHRMAQQLDRLLLGRTPLVHLDMPRLQGVLYGPDRPSLALIARFFERALRVPLLADAPGRSPRPLPSAERGEQP